MIYLMLLLYFTHQVSKGYSRNNKPFMLVLVDVRLFSLLGDILWAYSLEFQLYIYNQLHIHCVFVSQF